jgi:hypothetical protein
MITVAGNVLTALLWPLAMLLWPLWLLFSELCDWADMRGQRRYRAALTSMDGGAK